MTPAEYTQLKAFARVDGAYLGAAWVVSFALSIVGLQKPMLGMLGSIIALLSPIGAAMLVRRFRDNVRDGIISFARAAGYYILLFLYAALLLALAQYVYFAFIDNGYLANVYAETMRQPEMMAMMKAYGFGESQMEEAIQAFNDINPIYIVLNILSMNVVLGGVLSLPMAALLKRNKT